MLHNSVRSRRRSGIHDIPHDVPNVMSNLVTELCSNIDSPKALAVWLCFQHDHSALVDLSIDPKHYGDNRLVQLRLGPGPSHFADDLFLTEWLSKYKGLDLGLDTARVALDSFIESERRMKAVNNRLRLLNVGGKMPCYEAVIATAQQKIRTILGDFDNAALRFGWGPGASYSVKSDVAWDKKILEKRISVTASALRVAQAIIGADIHWCRARGIPADAQCSLLPCEFVVVPGSRITTVPKNAKTDRCIAVEPTANIYLQKGLGWHIRSRLKKCCRIDLDDQGTNQRLARSLRFATIDLKSASDSISIELIRLLLPPDWVDALEAVRSQNYRLNDDFHRFEKWSSMGNGYTFELETLVFYSICYAVQSIYSDRPFAAVYGDDILIPVDSAQATLRALDMFGFIANVKKTHYEYLYRESCGFHWYDGLLVTPIYQKEVPNHVAELYHLANRLRHFASRLCGYHYSDKRLRSAWLVTLQHLPVRRSYSPVCPDLSNDALEGSVHLSLEDLLELGLPRYSYGSKTDFIVFVPKKRRFDSAAGYARVLSSDITFEGTDLLSVRGRGVYRTRRRRVFRSFSSNIWL